MGGTPAHIASGPVDYPAYMKSWHGLGLAVEGESLSVTLTGAMNETFSNNPYSDLTLMDVDTILLGGKQLSDYSVPFSLLSSLNLIDLSSVLNSFRTTNQLFLISQDTNPFVDSIIQTTLDENNSQLEQDVLSNYKANARSINAVMCSSFIVGEAIIRSNVIRKVIEDDITQRQVSIYTQTSLIELAEGLNLKCSAATLEMRKEILGMVASFTKLYSTVKVNLDESNMELIAKSMLHNLNVFQYGGNFLGSIAGKTAAWVDPGDCGLAMSYGQGILSGVSMGAMIGSSFGPIGTVVGAVIGAIVGVIFGYIANKYHYASASDAAIKLPIDDFTHGTFLQRFILFGIGW